MGNSIGKKIVLTVFGESHGSGIGFCIDNIPAGIKINYEEIEKELSERRPKGIGETERVEMDDYEIISGVFNGYTTGAPLSVIIKNKNTKSSDYDKNKPRPSHADYVAYMKYKGYNDYRGGGHFSGRLTASIVFAGAIFCDELKKRKIEILSHIKKIGSVEDRDYDFNNIEKDFFSLQNKKYKVIDDIEEKVEREIERMSKEGDSIGGIIQTAVLNMPVGAGEPMFDSIESQLSRGIFSIGATKGIEFGLGFLFADKKGSEVNDEIYVDGDIVKTYTNHNGGINGGISNGMPIMFNVAVKPTPSIYKEQKTINIEKMANDTLVIEGRHDPCIVRRICPVINNMTRFIVADILMQSGLW